MKNKKKEEGSEGVRGQGDEKMKKSREKSKRGYRRSKVCSDKKRRNYLERDRLESNDSQGVHVGGVLKHQSINSSAAEERHDTC